MERRGEMNDEELDCGLARQQLATYLVQLAREIVALSQSCVKDPARRQRKRRSGEAGKKRNE